MLFKIQKAAHRLAETYRLIGIILEMFLKMDYYSRPLS
jgi:hypothetical protein